jgi:methylmalonyl-CoA decarboxylase
LQQEGHVPLVLTQVDSVAAAGTITLNHDAKRNALSQALIEELIAALDEMRQSAVRSLILRARPGATVWSAGHDVSELPAHGRDPLAYDDPLRRLVRAIESFPMPVFALVEGGVWGGACELVTTCDLVVAGESATFAFTPAKLGVPYNTAGILNMMQSIGVPLLKEMLFLARPIPAGRALERGMINAVVPAETIDGFVHEMCTHIAGTSPLCVALLKEEIRVLSESRPQTPETFERLQGMRRRVYDSADYQEGIRSFLEKRKPGFKGE